MKTDKQQILNLVQEYIEQKLENEEWNPGEDWVSYSGPVFDASEYLAAVDVLLDGWMIFGKNEKNSALGCDGKEPQNGTTQNYI